MPDILPWVAPKQETRTYTSPGGTIYQQTLDPSSNVWRTTSYIEPPPTTGPSYYGGGSSMSEGLKNTFIPAPVQQTVSQPSVVQAPPPERKVTQYALERTSTSTGKTEYATPSGGWSSVNPGPIVSTRAPTTAPFVRETSAQVTKPVDSTPQANAPHEPLRPDVVQFIETNYEGRLAQKWPGEKGYDAYIRVYDTLAKGLPETGKAVKSEISVGGKLIGNESYGYFEFAPKGKEAFKEYYPEASKQIEGMSGTELGEFVPKAYEYETNLALIKYAGGLAQKINYDYIPTIQTLQKEIIKPTPLKSIPEAGIVPTGKTFGQAKEAMLLYGLAKSEADATLAPEPAKFSQLTTSTYRSLDIAMPVMGLSQVGFENYVQGVQREEIAQKEADKYKPGGEHFGFGAMERFKYASDSVFGKEGETDIVRGFVKGGINIIGGVPTYSADVTFQAIKNVPALFGEGMKRTEQGGSGGWSVLGEAAGFTATETVAGVGSMVTRGGQALGGNPVAFGESAVMIGSLVAPLIAAKTGRPVIDWASVEKQSTTASKTYDTLTGGTEFPIIGKDTYISVGWEKGASFSTYGGAKVSTSAATKGGVTFYKGEPPVTVEGFTTGPRALTPYQTKVVDIYSKAQTKFLENMKPAEQEGFALRQTRYIKSSKSPDLEYNALLKEYTSGVGKSSYSELKDISVLASEKGTPKMAQTIKTTVGEVKTLQTPDVITQKGVTGTAYEYITEARTGDIFGSTSQRVFMGKEMSRGAPADIDFMANQPGFFTSARAGRNPLRMATPEVQFGSGTIKGVKYRLSDMEYPTAKITPTNELVAREVTNELGGYYYGNRMKTEGGLVVIDKTHAFDIHNRPGFYESGEGGGYVGFGKPAEKPLYVREGRNVALDKITFEKGVGLQKLSEQAIAKGESAARPVESGIGFGPEAHRLKDVFDTLDIARFQAKRTGDVALLAKVEAFEAKLPKGFMEYFRKTSTDTPLTRMEEGAQFARSKASTSAIESGIFSRGATTGGYAVGSGSQPSKSTPTSSFVSFSPSVPSVSWISSTSIKTGYSLASAPSIKTSSKSSGISSRSVISGSPSPSTKSYSPSSYLVGSPSVFSPSYSPKSSIIGKPSYPSSPSSSKSSSFKSSSIGYPSSSPPSVPSSAPPSYPSSEPPSYPSSSPPSYPRSSNPPPPIIPLPTLGGKGGRNWPSMGGLGKLGKFKSKRKLQPLLQPFEQLRIEQRTGKALSAFVPSTPKTRAIYAKNMFGFTGKSGLEGLFNKKKRRR